MISVAYLRRRSYGDRAEVRIQDCCVHMNFLSHLSNGEQPERDQSSNKQLVGRKIQARLAMHPKYLLVVVQARWVLSVMLAALAQNPEKDRMMGQLGINFHQDRAGMDSFDGTSTPWYSAW